MMPHFRFLRRLRHCWTAALLLPRSSIALASPNSNYRSSSSSLSSTTTTNSMKAISPPTAHREPDRVVYAGVAPPGWNMEIPRQAVDSTEPLLDPPVPVPDPYGWMRDESRSNPQILEHLQAENTYTTAVTEHLQGLRESLYNEFLQGIQETDHSVPRPDGKYVYYTRTLQGKSYRLYCRAPRDAQGLWEKEMTEEQKIATPVLEGEEVFLDVNALAKDQTYCAVGSVRRTGGAEQNILAYTVDFSGNEQCRLFCKDLKTGTILHDPGTDFLIDGSIRWGKDQKTLFFFKQDAAQRPYQLYRRSFNDDMTVASDELLFEEPNDTYWMGMYKSFDEKYLFVETSSKETTEIHYLDLQDPNATLQCVAPRRPKVLYEVEHRDGMWWIASNVGGLPNMALFNSPVGSDATSWELVRDASGQALFDGNALLSLDDVTCFKNHVVASGRQGGLPRIWILRGLDTKLSMERLEFPEAAFDCGMGTHYEYDTDTLQVAYDSLVTPTQSLAISMNDTTQRTVLKEKIIPGYNPDDYACERVTVLSRDGSTEIPVSLVYRKDTMNDTSKPKPVHLYGYGSYGSCLEADFVASRLPLLRRGLVVCLAHVRGGGEMGRTWYEMPNGAKFLCKQNTFFDFIDIARWLVDDRKLTNPNLLSCEGRSAGGLLIGASINEAPELFRAAVLGVPFVDVVPTMIDASIPLTAVEFEEWGCPNEIKYFQYMMEYNPITNVKKAVYPACLLTGGLHDPRVQFWEPAKFAAELRHSTIAQSDRPICCKIDMGAGHFSASDRYKYLKEKAFDYAFILDQLGLADNQ